MTAMQTTDEQLRQWLDASEGSRFEFKEARQNYHFGKLVEYCVALANEGGGKIILGVSDRRPRHIVGTAAFAEPSRTEAGLYDRLHHRVPIEEILTPEGRILMVHVPGRLPSTAWQIEGRYLKRAGDELTALTAEELRAIFAEVGPDFSAEPCPGAMLGDLSEEAIADFRIRWARRANDARRLAWSVADTLTNTELLVDGQITYAALILFGTQKALGRRLAQAEIVFEYRSSEASGPAADRQEFREGFFLCYDVLWQKINLRNDRQSYQDGLFRIELPTFDEVSVREALLNAVAHEVRLTLEGSVQSPGIRAFFGTPWGRADEKFFHYDFLALDFVHRDKSLPDHLKSRLPSLIELGAIEPIGRGRGTRYILSQALYSALGARGVHTRKRGLDHETNKALIEKHLQRQGADGAPFSEVRQVLPSLSEIAVKRLLLGCERKAARVWKVKGDGLGGMRLLL